MSVHVGDLLAVRAQPFLHHLDLVFLGELDAFCELVHDVTFASRGEERGHLEGVPVETQKQGHPASFWNMKWRTMAPVLLRLRRWARDARRLVTALCVVGASYVAVGSGRTHQSRSLRALTPGESELGLVSDKQRARSDHSVRADGSHRHGDPSRARRRMRTR